MANHTIYPYGTGGQLPSSIGIIDDLETGGSDKALSAEQGLVLKEAIDSLHSNLANLAFIGTKPTMPWDEDETSDGDISNYVQDGLVLHLDGIDKGNVANQWTDLINGVDFPNHGATELENGWQFDGVDDYMGYLNDNSKSLNLKAGDCTIECCCYDNSLNNDSGTSHAGMAIIYLGQNNATGTNATNSVYLSLVYNANQRYINGVYVKGTTNVWQDQKVDIVAEHTISVNEERGYDNETSLSTLNANHWDSMNGGRTIGARWHPSLNRAVGFLLGKIFAIRIYNRILTETEMRQNQRVDNARFNLGISLQSVD